ncbi:hypothetical protein [Streptomyces sp. enrichment culture]|uniref:hypothetical protein n=1 Tax=Streptomyces sp. enrichment culture TaxID=1795815 RepID=UPI003F55F888
MTTDASDLDGSLRCHSEAASLAPDGSPVHGAALLELGRALQLHYVTAQDATALQEARTVLDEVARSPVLAPSARVAAAEELARCHAESGSWTRACAAYEYAIDLLPAVAPRYEERRTQEKGLSGFASLASDAAACALRLDDPERALRLLEAGRGLLLTQALEVRTDVTELRHAEPQLADRLTALRFRLDGTGTEFAKAPALPPGGLRRRAAESAGSRSPNSMRCSTRSADYRASRAFCGRPPRRSCAPRPERAPSSWSTPATSAATQWSCTPTGSKWCR